MRYITTDYIFPISSEKIKNGVVVMEGDRVKDVTTRAECSEELLEYHKGIILPGFVNAHCHLELSHMKGLVDSGTKLIPFIRNVVQLRDFEQLIIDKAIDEQDSRMYEAGIQAVGDISNKSHTARQKQKSPIRYYSFVEMFDFMKPELTDDAIANYSEVFEQFDSGAKDRKSFVPHAPYSVSRNLFQFINEKNPAEATISIHNQETLDENRLFIDGSGGFPEFFKGFGIELNEFMPTGRPSIQYALQHLKPAARNILVHNTLCTKDDIHHAHHWSSNVFWATCPNANLYIENRLPEYSIFLNEGAIMVIGTDSIMSNWSLSIWDEVKTIRKFNSYIPIEEIFQWATLNGARALGFEDETGSIEKGKRPGLVQIDLDWQGQDSLLDNSGVTRIV